MRSADGRGRCFAQAQVTHLPLPHQFSHRTDGVLDGDVWIDAVLIVQVDVIDAQPPERALAGLAHVLRPAVYASPSLTVRAAHETELRGDPHVVPPAANRFAD